MLYLLITALEMVLTWVKITYQTFVLLDLERRRQ